jgi:serine/threonine-protein kinase HipA
VVLWDEIRAGVLAELDEGGFEFRYDAAYLGRNEAAPISLTLPLRDTPYTRRSLHPFFLGLLPEGWLLEVSLRKLKLSPDDAFGLVLALCADCVGAVRVLPEDAGDG